MFRYVATVSAALLIAGTPSAFGGVTINELETISSGSAAPVTTGRIVMIEGNREKSSDNRQSMIFDLDKGKAIILNASTMSATELPFPFTGPLAALMQGFYGADVTFGTTGVSRIVAGYECAEYAGSGHLPTGEMTFTGCFSKDAPGAAEYTKFYKQFTAKMGRPTNFPEGIPLKLETRVKIVASAIQGLAPEDAERVAHAAAAQPPVTSSVLVSTVQSTPLPPETFAIPAGFKLEKVNPSEQ